MAFCAKCGTQVPDGTTFCPSCGGAIAGAGVDPVQAAPQQQYQYQQPYQAMPVVDAWDHTAEFDPQDVSENKVFALLGYLFSLGGVLFVYLGAKESKYAMFHAKNAVAITVVYGILILAMSLLSWTCIVPIAGAVCLLLVTIADIICIFDVFGGKAKEPWLVRGLKFLK